MSDIQISERPLLVLFGSESAYRVLTYLENYERGLRIGNRSHLRHVTQSSAKPAH